MSHNPYTPPAANVADTPLPPRGERPQAVRIALALLWLGLGLGILTQLFDGNNGFRSQHIGLVIWSQAVGLAVNVWLFVKIGAGRNWARIVYLVLLVISLPIQIFSVKSIFAHSMLAALLSIATALMNIVAMYFAFGPGRAWFRNQSPAS